MRPAPESLNLGFRPRPVPVAIKPRPPEYPHFPRQTLSLTPGEMNANRRDLLTRDDVDSLRPIPETSPERPVACEIPLAGRGEQAGCRVHCAVAGEGTSSMSTTYHVKLESGAMVTFGSPQAIQESLKTHWPAGRYEIHEGHSPGSPHASISRRWGTAVKREDGAVTMATEPGQEP